MDVARVESSADRFFVAMCLLGGMLWVLAALDVIVDVSMYQLGVETSGAVVLDVLEVCTNFTKRLDQIDKSFLGCLALWVSATSVVVQECNYGEHVVDFPSADNEQRQR